MCQGYVHGVATSRPAVESSPLDPRNLGESDVFVKGEKRVWRALVCGMILRDRMEGWTGSWQHSKPEPVQRWAIGFLFLLLLLFSFVLFLFLDGFATKYTTLQVEKTTCFRSSTL